MDDSLVINTGPLITLSKIGALDIAGKLPYHFLTPEQVMEELEAGRKIGHPFPLPNWLDVRNLDKPVRRFDTVILGKGEAAVIELAIELNVSRVCIDEVKGRRVATTAGLAVVGVLGLLGRAKTLGLIPTVGTFIDKALESGFVMTPN